MINYNVDKVTFWAASFFLIIIAGFGCHSPNSSQTIPITVENNSAGAPQTFGIPIPKGELYSPDHVRVLNNEGQEVPSQITQVSTWAPADSSIKWIWVFFFTQEGNKYTVEYGKNIHNGRNYEQSLYVKNNQRSNGEVIVNTGPLRFTINKGGSGFFDKIELDTDADGFDEDDLIAKGSKERGTFLDMLDDAGIDRSKAVIKQTYKELGSGPLHSIIRIEGEYYYSREDNKVSPFVTRIHSYAGKSYLKVLHTITYTGNPDKHKKVEGEYELIATGDHKIKDQKKMKGDEGWTQPDDRILAAGLSLKYNLGESILYRTAYYPGSWWQPGQVTMIERDLPAKQQLSLYQTGPKPNRVPPVPNSTSKVRLRDGYNSSLTVGEDSVFHAERVPGWIDISDNKWGISIGIRNYFKEYPKEIRIQQKNSMITPYIWSPKADPMGFVRKDTNYDSQMIANFATGLSKTTEVMYRFHSNGDSTDSLYKTAQYFLDPPVTHATPQWYANSKVFGNMSAYNKQFEPYERGLDYKFKWMQFNQKWEPWYGIWDYGDFKSYYFKDRWVQWTNNEPAVDYMWWLQYVRTGNREYYLTATAASRHTMDIDNIHWPKDYEYRGDTNASLDYFKSKKMPSGSPYVGMGRRHASQQWTALLSAHVWVAGWITSYYMDAYHRGLEVAELTGEYYIKRVFGDHGLRGRRLYLSVWNLAELWDATKKQKYKDELDYRVRLMLELQKDADQAGSLVINRYGYAQVYASNGLRKYEQMTGNKAVRDALIVHARRLRDVPPFNHDMESYLSSISSLVLGYNLSGEKSLLDEAIDRARFLKTGQLPLRIQAYPSQDSLAQALAGTSNLPDNPYESRPSIWKITNGLRVFGWTHVYNVPYLIHSMKEAGITPAHNKNGSALWWHPLSEIEK